MGRIMVIGFDFNGIYYYANVVKLTNGKDTEYHVNILRDNANAVKAQKFVLELIDGKIILQDPNAFHDHNLIRACIKEIEEYEKTNA
jgi:hypothetical protein